MIRWGSAGHHRGVGNDTATLPWIFAALLAVGAAGGLPGCDELSASDNEASTPSSAKPAASEPQTEDEPEQPALPEGLHLLSFSKDGKRGLVCDLPSTGEHPDCGIVITYDTIHFAGPVGTTIALDDEQYVLGDEHALDKKGKRRLFDQKLRMINNADAHFELPWPPPALLKREFPGACTKGNTDQPPHVFKVAVRLPGSDTPLEAMKALGYDREKIDAAAGEGWDGLRVAWARQLEEALDPDAKVELPPLAEGAKGVIYQSICYGAEVSGLKDVRYVVRTVEPYQDESLRRKKKCGTYRSKSNYVKELAHTMNDRRVEIWDARARKLVTKKRFRAPTPKCPSKITESTSGEYSGIDYDAAHDWVRKELVRRFGPRIEPA